MSTTILEEKKVPEAVDGSKVEAFAGKVLGDLAAMMASVQCAYGDRFGLFKDMAQCGPQTPEEIAACTKTDPRYIREWASCLATAGYIRYDPGTGKFALPAEHVPVLAEEGGATFMGGFHSLFGEHLRLYEDVATCFKNGGGVPRERFSDALWEAEERTTQMWHDNLLVQQWIPLLPEVKSKLEKGGTLLDVGCGRGRPVVRLAKAFPKAKFVGIDIHQGSVDAANALAKQEGVSDRVRFERRDAGQPIPGKYDVATAFDVIHDLADPKGTMRNIRGALAPGGLFVMLEINCGDRLEDNLGLFGTLFYGISVFHCMTLSLSQGGVGLGTAGLPEARVREFAKETGFSGTRKVDIQNPFNVIYELKA